MQQENYQLDLIELKHIQYLGNGNLTKMLQEHQTWIQKIMGNKSTLDNVKLQINIKAEQID